MNRTFQFILFGSLIIVGIWYLTRQDYRPVAGDNQQQSLEELRSNMRNQSNNRR